MPPPEGGGGGGKPHLFFSSSVYAGCMRSHCRCRLEVISHGNVAVQLIIGKDSFTQVQWILDTVHGIHVKKFGVTDHRLALS